MDYRSKDASEKFENQPIKDVLFGNQPNLLRLTFDERIDKQNPISVSTSKFAYVTLLSGIDNSFRYRGFLYNTIIMKRALEEYGSKEDFIVMIGFSHSEKNLTVFNNDLDLLSENNIIIYHLPRYVDDNQRLSFAEMALQKISPWSFTQYKRVQYFDGDVMPTRNMDCFFELNYNAFTTGAASPLNSGWYLAIPNNNDYEYMKTKALWRLSRDWNKQSGWEEEMPRGLYYRGGKKMCDLWDFNGADMDQGLFLHRFVLNRGRALLIDTESNRARLFKKGYLGNPSVDMKAKKALACCKGVVPTRCFAHFTGRSKPWMLDLNDLKDSHHKKHALTWAKRLDELNLTVNSKNLADHKFSSPLGFFNANFPKGGFKSKDKNKHENKL